MRGILIFSGYNQRAVVAFLRTLTEKNIDKYEIVSLPEDTILKTSYADKVILTREDNGLTTELFSKIRGISRFDSLLLAPSTEAINRFALDNRSKLEAMGYEIPLVGKELYKLISDKRSFYGLCCRSNINVPELIDFPSKFIREFVAKPAFYYSKEGKQLSPALVKTESDYSEFCRIYDEADFDIEEYVEGESYYLLFYFSKSGMVYSCSQKNVAQQPHGKSIVAAVPADIQNEEITEKYIDLFRGIGFTGLVMIELRKRNGEYFMIEANPRFWGPSQLFVNMGYNLFTPFLFDFGFCNLPDKMVIDKNVKYLWQKGIFDSQSENEQIAYFEQCEDEWYLTDEWVEWDVYNMPDTERLFH